MKKWKCLLHRLNHSHMGVIDVKQGCHTGLTGSQQGCYRGEGGELGDGVDESWRICWKGRNWRGRTNEQVHHR